MGVVLIVAPGGEMGQQPEVDIAQLRSMLIEYGDVPSDWSKGVYDTVELDVPNGLGLQRWMSRSHSQRWVNVSEELYWYRDNTLAAQAYRDILDKYGRLPLQGWEQAPFSRPDMMAKQSHIACMEGYVDGWHHYACRVVAVYDGIVLDLAGNIFDDRWLTEAQFIEVVESADHDVTAGLEQLAVGD